tara:strand:- start:4065 stop:6314 length:2250 start_codon:yes stop_codon:yes gene_type:complete
MQVLKEITFSDSSLEVNSLSYTYRQDLEAIIDSIFLVDSSSSLSLQNLKVKVLFSNIELEDPDFSLSEENYVLDFLANNRLSLSISNNLTVKNLFVYLYFYDLTGSPFTSYEKVFFEELILEGQVISGNFVDLRLENSNSLIQTVLDQKQVLSSEYKSLQSDLFKQQFISDLFYNIKQNSQVNLFFGIDQEGYFKKENFIPFLDEDVDFISYLKENNFITSIEGYVYNSKDYFKIDTNPLTTDLKYLFGDMYQANFQTLGDLHRTENYGYKTTCRLKNATVEYSVNELLPALKQEADLLLSLRLTDNVFTYLFKEQIKKTLDSLKGIVLQSTQDLGDTFTIFDSSEQILLDNRMVKFLLLMNKNAIEIITKNIEIKRLSSSNLVTLSKDYGQIIDLKNIKNATEVHGFGVGNLSLVSVTLDQYRDRASQELEKYFDSPSTTIENKSGEQEVDLTSLSYGYLTGLGNIVNSKNVLNNNKSVNFNFSYDDYLEYISAIDKIVSQKINYDFKISNSLDLEGVTTQEFIVEQQSEQISSILNSLTAIVVPNLKEEKDREEFLKQKENIIKTFEIPSVLRTDLCVDNVIQSDPNNDSLTKRKADPSTFIGNNVFAFSVITNLQKFTDKNFYEFYRFLETNDLDPQTTPLQTIFLKKYYSGEFEEKYEFLNKNNLYKNFVVYGLIYFMFKNLFKIMIYLPEERDYVVIDRNVLEGLESGQNYLCFVDTYTSERTGVKTPERLQTSIYNRYFVIEA